MTSPLKKKKKKPACTEYFRKRQLNKKGVLSKSLGSALDTRHMNAQANSPPSGGGQQTGGMPASDETETLSETVYPLSSTLQLNSHCQIY